MAAATAEDTLMPEEDDPRADNRELRLIPEVLISLKRSVYCGDLLKIMGWWDR
jgi:hypothetical protein